MAIEKLPKLKLFCRQGKTFRHPFYFADEFGNITDLSGYTARMEVRTQFPNEDSTAEDDDVLIRIDTDSNGGITIDGAKGELVLEIDAATTATFPEGSYFYEPELVAPSGDVIDFFAPSSFVVLPEVTL